MKSPRNAAPRVPLSTSADWSEAVAQILAATQPAAENPDGTGPPNILYTLGHHPTILPAFLGLSAALALRGVLPRRESEILALRASFNGRSPFEWGHHVEYAEAEGLGEEEIARLAQPLDRSQWSERDGLLIQAADELHAERDLSDATFAALSPHLTHAELVEAMYIVGHYTALSMVANATRVPLEDRLPAWPDERRE